MQLAVFEQAYLLQAIGWAIANSFWQAGVLWLLYQGITAIDKKMPALVKYRLSLLLLLSSLSWFILTIVKSYGLFSKFTLSREIILYEEIIGGLKAVNNILPFLSVVYLVLLCCFTVTYFRNLYKNQFLQKNGLTKAPIDFRLFTRYTAIELGIKRKIQVWLSEHVDVPSVTGFINPVILLPAAIVSQLTVQQIEAILLHELAHVKRNDYLVNLFQSIIELILFFNPFALLLSKTAKREREYCCDDWVINFKYNQHDYAKALVLLEEQRQMKPLVFALAATSGKKNLLLRVKRLFKATPQTSVSAIQQFKLTVLSFLLLLGICSLLPFFNNHPEIVESDLNQANSKFEKTSLVNSEKHTRENYSASIIKSPLKKSLPLKSPVNRKKIIQKQPGTNPGEEYVNAFINEELLNPNETETPILPSQVVEKEFNHSNYIIKIEEQQSGKTDITTYYLQLDNKDGNAGIKPLLIFNKGKLAGKRTTIKSLTDTLVNTKKTLVKKKITS